MRLKKARVRDYRGIIDSGEFEIERDKTILVGPNEAGKTALLQALQKLNAPKGSKGFDALRDYPRSKYNEISAGRVKPEDVTVVEAEFTLDDDDLVLLPAGWKNCSYTCGRRLNNTDWHRLNGAPNPPSYAELEKDLIRLASHADSKVPPPVEGQTATPKPSQRLHDITSKWNASVQLSLEHSKQLSEWLKSVVALVDENNKAEESRLNNLLASSKIAEDRARVLEGLYKRRPVFVLYSNYFRVRPLIHLRHLADRLDKKVYDDEEYDYGNACLLKLLGFTARQLSDLGEAPEPSPGDTSALQSYRDQLDRRQYQLNAAEVRLTDEIRSVWMPNHQRGDADKLRLRADRQYLKAVVEDDLGVEIELDQRSEGFQWLVSFFVVFFAEAQAEHKNAILLLDEPGLSLHALKQRDFRQTISRLSQNNQTLYTTHSPFMVGPDELDLVRVVEMQGRKAGTKVHTTVNATDPAALLPLQEALGYDLAQSLFTQKRNLILEGLTDYWYLDGVAALLRDAGIADLDEKIALVPSSSASKVVYFATILHAQSLKVATLLDSDAAGDSAAKQDTLVHVLGNKRILRAKDYELSGQIAKAEIEDLLRETLIKIATDAFGIDVSAKATSQPTRPIVDIFEAEISTFSKYKLAKAFLKWTKSNDASALTSVEVGQFQKLIAAINGALK